MPKKTFERAEIAGAILITQAKDNQEALRKQLEHGCRMQEPIASYVENAEKSHGRIEQRTYEIFKAMPMLNKWQKDWPYIRKVIRVTRCREEIRKSKPTITIHYYVSNRELKPEKYAKYIREHWWTENKLNHVKDVAFLEDSLIKHCNPYIYSTCIDIALNIMRINNIKNIKSTLYRNALDFQGFLNGLINVF